MSVIAACCLRGRNSSVLRSRTAIKAKLLAERAVETHAEHVACQQNLETAWRIGQGFQKPKKNYGTKQKRDQHEPKNLFWFGSVGLFHVQPGRYLCLDSIDL